MGYRGIYASTLSEITVAYMPDAKQNWQRENPSASFALFNYAVGFKNVLQFVIGEGAQHFVTHRYICQI